jgi:hypothetical protein
MALSKLTYNSLNVTAAASKGIGFDSDPDALQADYTGGSIVFIKKLTASSSGTLSFVDGSASVVLDNTYKEYLFTLNNIHPSSDNDASFEFNVSIDSGSNYNVAKTTTAFQAYHDEADTSTGLAYSTGADLAQGTGFQILGEGANLSADNDHGLCGYLRLFNPSSTTFVKHFIAETSSISGANYEIHRLIGGYANTTSAVDAVQFKMSSNNVDAGDICLYGIN